MGYKTNKGFETAIYKGVGGLLKALIAPKPQPARRAKPKTKSKARPTKDIIYARKEIRHAFLEGSGHLPMPSIVLYADEAMTFVLDMSSTTTSLRPKRSDSFYRPLFSDVTYKVIWLEDDTSDHGEVFELDYDIEDRMRIFKFYGTNS